MQNSKEREKTQGKEKEKSEENTEEARSGIRKTRNEEREG
jgi:hypothetical protein